MIDINRIKTTGIFIIKLPGLAILLFGIFQLILFNGCDKQHAKELAGNYNCIVQYNYWDMIPTSIDSTYSETLEVTRSGKFLTVLNHEVHIDSLWNGQEYYEGYIHNYIKIRFQNETIFVTSHFGGLGGGATWKYEGNKE